MGGREKIVRFFTNLWSLMALESHSKRDGAHSKRNGAHSKRNGPHLKRNGAHLKRDGAHLKRVGGPRGAPELFQSVYFA